MNASSQKVEGESDVPEGKRPSSSLPSYSPGAAEHEYDNISPARASTMLKLGLPGPRNAADDLIDHLESATGSAWLMGLSARDPFLGLHAGLEEVLAGKIDLEKLRLLKERGKEMVKHPANREMYLTGLAGYYIAIAAAMAFHHESISRTPLEEMRQILLEFAAVLRGELGELFTRAAKW